MPVTPAGQGGPNVRGPEPEKEPQKIDPTTTKQFVKPTGTPPSKETGKVDTSAKVTVPLDTPQYRLQQALSKDPPNNMQVLKACDELEAASKKYYTRDGKPTTHPTEEQQAAQASIQARIDIIRESIKNGVPVEKFGHEEVVEINQDMNVIHPYIFDKGEGSTTGS